MGRGRRLARAARFGLVFAVPMTALAFVVRVKLAPLIGLDESAIRAATDITRETPWLRPALVDWQEATQPVKVYLAASAVCLAVWRRYRLPTRAAWAFVTMMIAWPLQLLLKEIVRRARPVLGEPVSSAPGFSFPSGHVANAAAAASVVVILVWPLLERRGRVVAVSLASVVVVLTCLDRVFLGVHFPSDVVAGILFGVGLATASYLGYRGWNPIGPDAPPLPDVPASPSDEPQPGDVPHRSRGAL